MRKTNPVATISIDDYLGIDDLVDIDALVDQIYADLDGQVSRSEVFSRVVETASNYQNAIIKNFIPIFIRRSVIEQLRNRPK